MNCVYTMPKSVHVCTYFYEFVSPVDAVIPSSLWRQLVGKTVIGYGDWTCTQTLSYLNMPTYTDCVEGFVTVSYTETYYNGLFQTTFIYCMCSMTATVQMTSNNFLRSIMIAVE